jgi:hypothetical protein
MPLQILARCAGVPKMQTLSTELNRVGEPSLLVQNPDKFLDPFKRILILSTRIHNATPVASARARTFHILTKQAEWHTVDFMDFWRPRGRFYLW